MSSERQASRIVAPSGICTSRPSMVAATMRLGSPTNTGLAMQNLQLDHGRLDGAGRRLPQAADRGVAHHLRDLREQGDVGLSVRVAPVGKQPVEDLLLPLGADAAWNALAARLVPKELRDS